jgi:hypothetical protein
MHPHSAAWQRAVENAQNRIHVGLRAAKAQTHASVACKQVEAEQ